MKNYGRNKATEFTKKQIGVIFRMAKSGELNVQKWYMSRLYDLADYYGYDDNGSVEKEERSVLQILNAIFDGDVNEAQRLIDFNQEKEYNLLSRKSQALCDKNLIN